MPRKRTKPAVPPTVRSPTARAKTVPQFCEDWLISLSFYFKLKRHGQAPRELRIGTRTLITAEAEAEWLRQREAASKADTTTTAVATT
jgi:hypothetical protein